MSHRSRRPHTKVALALAIAAPCLLLFVRCVAGPRTHHPNEHTAPPTTGQPDNEAIVVAGRRFDIGTRVVLWHEPDGYSAYRAGKHFDRSEPDDGKARFERRSALAATADVTLEQVRDVVDQFVLHYDTTGTSRQCFKVLQDMRGLSVHFLLDVDGTIYQTLDLREKAWHATKANDRSIGVEIAHPGARKQPLGAEMRLWYERDDQGWRMRLPAWMHESGIRTQGFVARPARADLVRGEVHGTTYYQFDFTREQYRALAKLIAGIHQALPQVHIDAPRAANGEVLWRQLDDGEFSAFRGVLGHFHVQANKQDPGPAFQWQRVLDEARALQRVR